jgi:hypothetical protein
MADSKKINKLITLMNRGQQREAMDYLYDEMNGAELSELAQIGTRLTTLAESVNDKRSRERERQRRSIGGKVG